jgi:phosphoglycerate dehydrogenase-like enzyme
MGEALMGNRALVVGLGRVGRALARRLLALGMHVDAIRRNTGRGGDLDGGRVGGPQDLAEMAASADFVVSTAVLTDETRGMFGRAVFDAMKPTAFFVNVSRGPLVNETDLLRAVDSGSIAGAGLDVFQMEPLDPGHPLLHSQRIVCTPHVGGVTRQSVNGLAEVVAENIRRLKDGGVPIHCVNLDALKDPGTRR